jgi:hypothetical protein
MSETTFDDELAMWMQNNPWLTDVYREHALEGQEFVDFCRELFRDYYAEIL